MHPAPQGPSGLKGTGWICASRRHHLSGEGWFTAGQGLLKQQAKPFFSDPSWNNALPTVGFSLRPGPMDSDRSTAGSLGQGRHDLSEREIEIIELVAQGLTNQEIAAALTISKRTVDNHVSNIFTKTGAKNRVALLNWAMDHGKICRDGFNCCAIDGRKAQAN
jgi:DNA-binding CsgD family transcriptional regulator